MNRWYWIIAMLLTVFVWGVSAWFYPSLPQTIPTHWNIHGQVDGHGDKGWSLFLLPLTNTAMLIFFWFLPALSPRRFEVDSFRSTYLFIMVATLALFAYLQVIILLATLQEVRGGAKWLDLGRAMLGGMFVFFGLVGSVMGKVRKNFYIGVRVPWTLASDRVWDDTHRLTAWLMTLGGVVGLVVVLTGLSLWLAIGVMTASVMIPVVYSFVHYKALERRGAL